MKNEKKEKSEKNRKKPRKPENSIFLRGTAGKLLFLMVKEKQEKAGPERPASFFQKISKAGNAQSAVQHGGAM